MQLLLAVNCLQKQSLEQLQSQFEKRKLINSEERQELKRVVALEEESTVPRDTNADDYDEVQENNIENSFESDCIEEDSNLKDMSTEEKNGEETEIKSNVLIPCAVCSIGFAKGKNLKQHFQTDHPRENPFTCAECKKSFVKFENLKDHRGTHTGEKNVSCNICLKLFVSRSVLKVHTRIHSGFKPFSCSHCKKAFHTKSNLKNHILKHSEEKPYTCDKCTKSYYESGALKQHKFTPVSYTHLTLPTTPYV